MVSSLKDTEAGAVRFQAGYCMGLRFAVIGLWRLQARAVRRRLPVDLGELVRDLTSAHDETAPFAKVPKLMAVPGMKQAKRLYLKRRKK